MEKKSKNKNLNSAKEKKNDEFYTRLTDIEKELSHYKDQLKGKTIFCNCDDPGYSDFFKYFVLQFKAIGIKKLVTTHFQDEKPSYKLEVNAKNLSEIFPYISNTSIFDDGEIFRNFGIILQENGDFRTQESIMLLQEADVVITNPPFSLFREYIAQLMEYKKKFLIIGSDNAVTYKGVFNLIKENKIWLGYTKVKEFKRPDGSTQKFGNIGWYTNLDVSKRHENLISYVTYKGNEHKFPKYDNYDAIDVSKTVDIPIDYTGVMGVPITFLDKHNPDQFELLGSNRDVEQDPNGIYGKSSFIHGKETFKRIFIRRKNFNS